jgi:hypothetical protein
MLFFGDVIYGSLKTQLYNLHIAFRHQQHKLTNSKQFLIHH